MIVLTKLNLIFILINFFDCQENKRAGERILNRMYTRTYMFMCMSVFRIECIISLLYCKYLSFTAQLSFFPSEDNKLQSRYLATFIMAKQKQNTAHTNTHTNNKSNKQSRVNKQHIWPKKTNKLFWDVFFMLCARSHEIH